MNKQGILILFALVIIFSGCKAARSFEVLNDNNLKPWENISSTPADMKLAGPFYNVGFDDPQIYDLFLQQSKEVGDIGRVNGAIVPHHLVGGYLPATLFKYLSKQEPSLIVLFGPNHFNKGGAKVISTGRSWQTPFGTVKNEYKIAKQLSDVGVLKIVDDVFEEEHSISSLIPFIGKMLSKTEVLPIIFPYYTDTATLDNLINALVPLLPKDAVIVSSIDFSHYQNPTVAGFHDELNRAVIRNFEYPRIQNMEIDSPASVYMLLKIMELNGAQSIGFEARDISSNLMKNEALEETTSYYSPYFVSGAKGEDRLSSMLFFGDMMLDRSVKKQIDANGSDYIFTKLAGEENRFFMGSDIVHANLEGPFADARRATSKEIAFRFDPLLIPTLKKYGFDMFSQANNHSMDMGSDGFKESLKNLNDAGFQVYGTQYRMDDDSIAVRQVGNNTILFIGLNDTNTPVDIEKFKKLIQRGQEIDQNLEPEYTVVNIHWGQEYKEVSNSHQRELAHTLIDTGADIIIGHHPHVVQEMEIYKNRPIFYSLGNFVFDQYFSVPTQEGLGVGIVLRRDSISIYPTALEQNKSQVSQMPYEKRNVYLKKWIEKSRLENNVFQNNILKVNFN